MHLSQPLVGLRKYCVISADVFVVQGQGVIFVNLGKFCNLMTPDHGTFRPSHFP
jgi:hypothetical protein